MFAQLLNEKTANSVDEPECPRLIDNINISRLYQLLITEEIGQITNNPKYSVVFTVANDVTSDIVRAIQEDQILKTKISLKKGKNIISLPSFWEIWKTNAKFRNKLIHSIDPNEAKWGLSREFGYKLATTFMPCYAMSVYKYFGCPEIVLDPCSGWGDRLLGAQASGVKTYIGYDPNSALRAGYGDIMKVAGVELDELTDIKMTFSNSYEMHAVPFECNTLEDGSVDFIFTSPPFFTYEIYSETNPQYDDWIEDFYKPFFIHCGRIIKPDGYVCVYLADTNAGLIERFMSQQVPIFTNLVLQKSIGFKGIWSNEIREMYVFKKEIIN